MGCSQSQAFEVTKLEKLSPLDNEYKEVAWGVQSPSSDVKPLWIARPNVTAGQVKFELLYCGICHTDCHFSRNELGQTTYPCIPGHELLGKVTEIGEGVTKVNVGDYCAVGCMVDACLDCKYCNRGDEQMCVKGSTFTYDGVKQHGRVAGNQETKTHGGYSGSAVVHEKFVIKIPEGMDIEKAAPILCAGITMYDPLRHWGFTDGAKKTVGIIGIGGLGTMGIKLAVALGHEVVAISTSANKEKLAKDKGATHFVVSSDKKSIEQNAGKCDLILNTISGDHDINTYLPLLAKDGVIVQLGLALKPHSVNQVGLMFTRQSIAGSLIGGIAATQECIDLCHRHNIYPDCQLIEAKEINWAWAQLTGKGGNKDGVRYVIDIKKSLQNSDFLPK